MREKRQILRHLTKKKAMKDGISKVRQHAISCEIKELKKNHKLYKKAISKMIKLNGRRHRSHTSTTLEEVISRQVGDASPRALARRARDVSPRRRTPSKRLRQQEAAAGESSGKRARADSELMGCTESKKSSE